MQKMKGKLTLFATQAVLLSSSSKVWGGKIGVGGCVPDSVEALCRRYVDFETSRNAPLQNLAQEQVYFVDDLEFFSIVGSLGIETT